MSSYKLLDSFRAIIILVCFSVASCGVDDRRFVDVDRYRNEYRLKFRIDRLVGFCFAPRSFNFNGNLQLVDFRDTNRWTIVPATPKRVDGLADILRMDRRRIGSDGVMLSVPKQAVVMEPSYIQLVAFPCDAPRTFSSPMKDLFIISASVDLPISSPPSQEPYHPSDDPDDQMLNQVVPSN